MTRPSRKLVRSEAEILAGILGFLSVKGVFAFRNNSGGYSPRPGQFLRFGMKGAADIIGVLPGGLFLAIEVKRDGEDLTRHQKEWGARVTSAGGLYVVARSVEDVLAVLAPGLNLQRSSSRPLL